MGSRVCYAAQLRGDNCDLDMGVRTISADWLAGQIRSYYRLWFRSTGLAWAYRHFRR